eukprot:77488-Chlamydomonas_euryale.AAC.1
MVCRLLSLPACLFVPPSIRPYARPYVRLAVGDMASKMQGLAAAADGGSGEEGGGDDENHGGAPRSLGSCGSAADEPSAQPSRASVAGGGDDAEAGASDSVSAELLRAGG